MSDRDENVIIEGSASSSTQKSSVRMRSKASSEDSAVSADFVDDMSSGSSRVSEMKSKSASVHNVDDLSSGSSPISTMISGTKGEDSTSRSRMSRRWSSLSSSTSDDASESLLPVNRVPFPEEIPKRGWSWYISYWLVMIIYLAFTIWRTVYAFKHQDDGTKIVNDVTDSDFKALGNAALTLFAFWAVSALVSVILATLVQLLFGIWPVETTYVGLVAMICGWTVQVVTKAIDIGKNGWTWSRAFSITGSAVVLGVQIWTLIRIRHGIGMVAPLMRYSNKIMNKNWGLRLRWYVCIFIQFSAVVMISLGVTSVVSFYMKNEDGKKASPWPVLLIFLFMGFILVWSWNQSSLEAHMIAAGSHARYEYLGEQGQGNNPTKWAYTRQYREDEVQGGLAQSGQVIGLGYVCDIVYASHYRTRWKDFKIPNFTSKICSCCPGLVRWCCDVSDLCRNYTYIWVEIYGTKCEEAGKFVGRVIRKTGFTRLLYFADDKGVSQVEAESYWIVFSTGLVAVWGLSHLFFSKDFNNTHDPNTPKNKLHDAGSDLANGNQVHVDDIYKVVMYTVIFVTCGIYGLHAIYPLTYGARVLIFSFMEDPSRFREKHPELYAQMKIRAERLGIAKESPEHFESD